MLPGQCPKSPSIGVYHDSVGSDLVLLRYRGGRFRPLPPKGSDCNGSVSNTMHATRTSLPRPNARYKRTKATVRCSAQSPDAPSWTERLKRAGRSGILAYGVLNVTYYATAFAIAAQASTQTRATSVQASLGNATKLLAVVWAGSQATKPLRAAIAVGLAPVCASWLRAVQRATGVKTEAKAFAILVAITAFVGLSIMAICAIILC
mmetsp:Transcript_3329/g.20771  ORF Transcript_3329/g.20771 Transcript_3329/m.20771 type:complete len:206 (-) Transcript_3329:931-1548(-)